MGGVRGLPLLGCRQKRCSRHGDRPRGLVHTTSEGPLGEGQSFLSSLGHSRRSVLESSPQADIHCCWSKEDGDSDSCSCPGPSASPRSPRAVTGAPLSTLGQRRVPAKSLHGQQGEGLSPLPRPLCPGKVDGSSCSCLILPLSRIPRPRQH